MCGFSEEIESVRWGWGKTFYGSFYFFMKKILLAFLILFVVVVSSKVLIVSIILGVEIEKSLVFLCVFVVLVVIVLYNACIH